uniref:Uncharacterized protein n=1 Tax=Tanacetum cinerariifolium TaxID=118510 RepID=A0A6L2KHE1_TANCI|nr:hypothetical protein [Tanacetum cinerariifolium]
MPDRNGTVLSGSVFGPPVLHGIIIGFLVGPNWTETESNKNPGPRTGPKYVPSGPVSDPGFSFVAITLFDATDLFIAAVFGVWCWWSVGDVGVCWLGLITLDRMQMISIMKEEVIDSFVMGFRCFPSRICGLRFDVLSQYLLLPLHRFGGDEDFIDFVTLEHDGRKHPISWRGTTTKVVLAAITGSHTLSYSSALANLSWTIICAYR